MAELLFVYGTLRPGHAPLEIADTVRSFVPLGRATVRGQRYDFGEYPGVVLDEAGERVQGEVFAVPEHAWEGLDAYEGYRPHEPAAASLFLRVRVAAQMEDGREMESWIYVYNRKQTPL